MQPIEVSFCALKCDFFSHKTKGIIRTMVYLSKWSLLWSMNHPCVGTLFLNFNRIYLPWHNETLHGFYFLYALISLDLFLFFVLTSALSISTVFYYVHLLADTMYSSWIYILTQNIRACFIFFENYKW